VTPFASGKIADLAFIPGRLFSFPYGVVMKGRQWLYDAGIKRKDRLPCMVISIGNLSMGGTGKTPHVIACAKYLLRKGYRPAVVTRGYGGRAGKGPLVVSDGEKMLVKPDVAGDEPCMMGEYLDGVPVMAGSDRYSGGMHAVREFGADTVILDDGFQHISLERDFDLVLMPVTSPVWKQRVFPGGELREPVSALAERASALMITRSELTDRAELEKTRKRLSGISCGVPVYSSRNEFSGFTDLYGNSVRTGRIREHRLLVVAAIGEPESLLSGIRNAGLEVKEAIFFRDHHRYTPNDIASICQSAREKACQYVVVTSKDAVKIKTFGNYDTVKDKGIEFVVIHTTALPEPGFWRFFDNFLENGTNRS
jgi:tetraacyldisaccharide 4'-kinase